MIVLEGSHLDRLIIINSGKVKAFRNTFEGKEQILYIFSKAIFSEKRTFNNQTAQYNVEALEETHVCTIKKNDFKNLLREYPELV